MDVALVQLASGLDLERNRLRASEAVRAAAGAGAELVVLPEAAMCGFGSPTTPLGPLAEPLDGPFVTALADLASKTGATVVAGMFERPAASVAAGGRVHNTLVAVGPGGLQAVYRKLHLYDALGWRESARVLPGELGPDALALLALGGLTFGLLTCYDLRFPELARALAVSGATALLVPAAWVAGPRKAAQWGDLLRARAIESALYVLAAAQPGPDYTGRSAVVDPAGVVLAEADGDADGPPAGLVVVGLDPTTVADVRAGMPVLEARRFDVVPRR